MAKFRCPKGSRKCVSTGKCVRKSLNRTARCKRGTRKCANQVCYDKNTRGIQAAKVVQRAFRNRKSKTRKNKAASMVQRAFRNRRKQNSPLVMSNMFIRRTPSSAVSTLSRNSNSSPITDMFNSSFVRRTPSSAVSTLSPSPIPDMFNSSFVRNNRQTVAAKRLQKAYRRHLQKKRSLSGPSPGLNPSPVTRRKTRKKPVFVPHAMQTRSKHTGYYTRSKKKTPVKYTK